MHKASHLPKGIESITRRELQVIGLIAQSYSNKEIGEELGISVETVKRHLSNVFDKVGCFSRTELAIRTLSGGLKEKLIEGYEQHLRAFKDECERIDQLVVKEETSNGK